MSRFIVVFYLAIYVCAMKADEKDHGQLCRYWCRTIDHRYYCCPSGKAKSWLEYIWHFFLYPLMIAVEPPLIEFAWPEIYVREEEPEKHCPPLRAHCARTYDWLSPPPILCNDDKDCDKWEKCCYDICLEHKICKQAE
ncbi:hypothetical protein K0M31_018804 [Melipona bicolor]|uniref:WAP domain-containing protein n=1 Tax=Melipona bicolor TaxID=60889 RepID=A0AA40KS23_9HYME|nr:hypothetical protein K0M31_018804 [Melipona bicolor]